MGMEQSNGGGRVEPFTATRVMEEPTKNDEAPLPTSAIVLAAVGGMLLFLGLFFGLVAGLGIGGFIIPALGTVTLGAIMMMVGWNIWRKTRIHHQKEVERERDRLLCDYCGGQNAEGDLKCRFCGAPLR